MALTLLVVDDDPLIREAIELGLPPEWNILAVADAGSALKASGYNAALVDVHLTPGSSHTGGIELVAELRKRDPHLEIVSMSGDLTREIMEGCLRRGSSRFLAKPIHAEELKLTLEKIETWLLLKNASTRTQFGHASWIGQSPASQKVQKQIASMRRENGPILIEGESGTGKEVVAQLLHGDRTDTPMIAVNIASIPENLFESELFGHVKGAFTGADQNRMGLIEAANGGDLFLDEIEAFPLNQQVKLLRFLETGEVRRVGSKDTIFVHARVIAASNRSLETMVAAKEFREDLFWRLSGHRLQLPPLRERPTDVPELIKFFFSKEKVRKKVLSEEAQQLLMDYHWPGNVRELKRLCEQMINSAPLPIVRGEDVLPLIRPRTLSHGGTSFGYELSLGLEKIMAQFEASVLRKSLETYKDIDEAAKILQISRSSMYKKIKDYSIEWEG